MNTYYLVLSVVPVGMFVYGVVLADLMERKREDNLWISEGMMEPKVGPRYWTKAEGRCPSCGSDLIHNDRGIECSMYKCEYRLGSKSPFTKVADAWVKFEPKVPFEYKAAAKKAVRKKR